MTSLDLARGESQSHVLSIYFVMCDPTKESADNIRWWHRLCIVCY